MKNRRKGMIVHTLWLTKAESESIKESVKNLDVEGLKNFAMVNITEIIQNATDRGDYI